MNYSIDRFIESYTKSLSTCLYTTDYSVDQFIEPYTKGLSTYTTHYQSINSSSPTRRASRHACTKLITQSINALSPIRRASRHTRFITRSNSASSLCEGPLGMLLNNNYSIGQFIEPYKKGLTTYAISLFIEPYTKGLATYFYTINLIRNRSIHRALHSTKGLRGYSLITQDHKGCHPRTAVFTLQALARL